MGSLTNTIDIALRSLINTIGIRLGSLTNASCGLRRNIGRSSYSWGPGSYP